jgi:hypothetical protein
MQISYISPLVDDQDILRKLPDEIVSALLSQNGWIAHNGGLHVRGACLAPEWHSLRSAWEGKHALHMLYPSVMESDIPIAEDCFGDQFLIRDGSVLRLLGETGEVEELNLSWPEFLNRAEEDPIEFLLLQPLILFSAEGGILQPDELLSVYPPFATKEAEAGTSLRPIPNMERRLFLANFARQIADIEDGQQIEIVIKSGELQSRR